MAATTITATFAVVSQYLKMIDWIEATGHLLLEPHHQILISLALHGLTVFWSWGLAEVAVVLCQVLIVAARAIFNVLGF